MTSARRFLLFSAAMTALAAGCGGAAPEARSPARGPAEPTTIEEAQAQIASARAQLGGDANTGTSADAAPAPPPPPPPASAPSAPETSSTKSEDRKKTVESTPTVQESQCSSPCRALASMRRAVTALCRMTGDQDTRCLDARKTLQSSEARITPCAC